MTASGGTIAVGLVLVVVAGILNGSWNVSFHQKFGLAVAAAGRHQRGHKKKNDLQFDLAWVLFQFYAAILNIPVCLYWAGGPKRVHYIVSNSSALSIALVCVFSFLWGVGTVGFGVACQIAGVGLGTNLTICIIVVLGTFLPLCLEKSIQTAAGGVVVAGLVVCCAGLCFAVKSLQTRDQDEEQYSLLNAVDRNHNLLVEVNGEMTTVESKLVGGGGDDFKISGQESKDGSDETPDSNNKSDDQENGSQLHNGESIMKENSTPTAARQQQRQQAEYPTWQKVIVCIVSGIFATQLQFAFVFGQDMIDLAAADDGPGRTPSSGTSSVIWLFAISLGAPVSILYGLYKNQQPLRLLCVCPWYRHVLIILTTSIPWVTHIHLYGYSNTQLPDHLAAAVAWPVLMMTTVIVGLLWSRVILEEWIHASIRATRQLYIGLIIVMLGVITIMCSLAV